MATDGPVVLNVTVPGGTAVQPLKLLGPDGPDEADLVSDGVEQLKVPVPRGRNAAHEASAHSVLMFPTLWCLKASGLASRS